MRSHRQYDGGVPNKTAVVTRLCEVAAVTDILIVSIADIADVLVQHRNRNMLL